MKVRRILSLALLAALPWAIGCSSTRTASTTSTTSSNQGFFARLCGKKNTEPAKPAQACAPQWQSHDQAAMYQQGANPYQGSAMYMEGPSLSMGSSCNTCTQGSSTILPGSSLPCNPTAPGVMGQPGTPGMPNPAPSRTAPLAQPTPANPTKLVAPGQ